MSPNPAISLPPLSTPLVDLGTGNITLAWYEPLFGFYLRTGGQVGISLTSVSTTANNALANAATAGTNATLALTNSHTAQTAATQALTLATTLQTEIGTIGGQTGNALLKFNNLGDVLSPLAARANIGVSVAQLSVFYDGAISANKPKYIPVVRGFTIPANFAGTGTYCGTVPFANAIFTINLIRAGVTTGIGLITLINGGEANILSSGGTTLIQGDVLAVIGPAVPDANLTNVGISIAVILA